MLLLLLCWLLAAPSSVWGQNTEAVLQFSPSTLQVAAGQTIDVAVEVKEVVGLYGFDVTVSFDPAIVEVVDFDPALEGDQVALGLFLDPGFVIFNQARNDLGQLRLVMTQLNPSEAKNGSGNLMVIRFRARQAGETPLLLVAGELAQRDGTSFVPQLIDGQLAVTSAAPPLQSPTSIPAQLAGTPLPTTAPDLLPAAPQATPTGATPSSATPPGATPPGATPQAAATVTPAAADQASLAAVTPAPLNASSPTPAVPASAISTGTGADAAANVEFTEIAATAVPNETAASISDTKPEVVAASLMVEGATAVAADSATAVAVIGSGVAGDNGTDTTGSPQNSGQIPLSQVFFFAISLLLIIVLVFFFLSRKRQSKP